MEEVAVCCLSDIKSTLECAIVYSATTYNWIFISCDNASLTILVQLVLLYSTQ